MLNYIKKINFVLIALVVLAISSIGLAAKAADSKSYTLILPDTSSEDAKQIKKEITGSGIGDGGGGLENTYIVSKGDGRLPPMHFAFDRSGSNKKDSLIYLSQDVYCIPNPSGVTALPSLSLDKPEGSVYLKYKIGIAIAPGGTGAKIYDQSSYGTWVGPHRSSNKEFYLPGISKPLESEENDTPPSAMKNEVSLEGDGKYKNVKNESKSDDDVIRDRIELKDGINSDAGGEKRRDNRRELLEHHGFGNADDPNTQRNNANAFAKGCTPTPKSGNLVSNYQKLSDTDKEGWDQIIQNNSLSTPSGGTTVEDGTGSNCSGGSLGFIFCPLIDYMTKTINFCAEIIENAMQIRFLSTQGSAEQIRQAWQAILSVANIFLVVAFMIIIFSQASSAGLSNYNIKRMLPRLVVAAILMNLSFYICAIAIDISNIIGGSIMGFLVGENSIATSIISATGGNAEGNSIIGGAIAGAALIGLFFFLLTPVVLGILVVLIVLIGRHVILLALVLVSPLAFAAWLLPNTEDYFKKWYNLFLQLLIIYPLVMLVFGASLYMSNLIGSPDTGTSIIKLNNSEED